jgi:pantothenate kinase
VTALEATVPELVARARDLVARRDRALLGITGPPGSGKSTLAQALAEGLAPDAVIMPMDGFHLAQDELVRLGRQDRKGAPDTFDAGGYVAMLARIRAAEQTVYAPTFDRRIEEPVAGAIAVPPAVPLVLTEGNYLLVDEPPWVQVRDLLDAVWFVQLDPVVRLGRLCARHERHGKSAEAARAWVMGSDEPNAELVERTRDLADLVVTVVAGVDG